MGRRILALTLWGWAVWILLTWTRTISQLAFGLAAALAVAVACAGLGEVGAPWKLFDPRKLPLLVGFAGQVLVRIVRANLSLARRIWDPRLPLRSGMLILPTEVESGGGLTAVGLITSVIVDNQLVDLDRASSELQYHAVWVDSEDPDENYSHMNGPVERYVRRWVET
jgi:multicomponent Na+:H+ antiporter subunit E